MSSLFIRFSLTIAFFFLPVSINFDAAAQPMGILYQPAPSWGVSEWFQLPAGKATLDVHDFKGKVIYLYCFQNWCPGCHSHGFPLLQKLTRHYKDNDSVAFVAVQTTFEGFLTNTFAGAQKIAERYSLEIPAGQSGSNGQLSQLMVSYRTGGTPWSIVIDKKGIVQFNDFHIYETDAIRLIDGLIRSN
jgi:thiol-disulfide isomerase/thioredoxin